MLTMKSYLLLSLLVIFAACGDDESQVMEFTGNQMIYNLTNDPLYYDGSGTVTFKERVDGGVNIEVSMDPTGSAGLHPTHLHFGTFDDPDAEMAALLSSVDAVTGQSTTTLYELLDGTTISYIYLLEYDGSIKIHLDDDVNKKVVIAAANIGINASMDITDIAVCSSEKEAI